MDLIATPIGKLLARNRVEAKRDTWTPSQFSCTRMTSAFRSSTSEVACRLLARLGSLLTPELA